MPAWPAAVVLKPVVFRQIVYCVHSGVSSLRSLILHYIVVDTSCVVEQSTRIRLDLTSKHYCFMWPKLLHCLQKGVMNYVIHVGYKLDTNTIPVDLRNSLYAILGIFCEQMIVGRPQSCLLALRRKKRNFTNLYQYLFKTSFGMACIRINHMIPHNMLDYSCHKYCNLIG